MSGPTINKIHAVLVEAGRPLHINEIAARAGVSYTQASGALNGHKRSVENGSIEARSRHTGVKGIWEAVVPHTPAQAPVPTPRPQRDGVTIGEYMEVIGFTKTGVLVRTESGDSMEARYL